MKYAIAIAIAIFAASANAQDYSGSGYGGTEARQYANVSEGVVAAVREVSIQGEPSGAGQVLGGGLGALAGGLLGSKIGKGNGTLAASAVMGVLGAAAGTYGTQYLAKDRAYEFIIRLADGRLVSVTQAQDSNAAVIQEGDRVMIIEGGSVRVVKSRATAGHI